jgi:multidrug efflux pump subunit AcrA (membrane-fusion protein)
MRIFLQYVLPLVLPTAIYLAWWLLIGRTAKPDGRPPAVLREGPWFWLAIGGVALMAAGLAAAAMLGGGDPTGTYVPPRWEDGRVVPGRVVPGRVE